MLGHVLSNFDTLLLSLEMQMVFKQKVLLFAFASFSEVTELFGVSFFLLLLLLPYLFEIESLVLDNFNVRSESCTKLQKWNYVMTHLGQM